VTSEATGLSGIAKRYATALYELGDEAKSLDEVAGDLKDIQAMLAGSKELSVLVRSPLLDRQAQAETMAAVLAEAGIGDLTRRFVGVIARNRRLFALGAIIDAFLTLLAMRRGAVIAKVASARSLSDDQIAAVTEALKRVVGAKVSVDLTVDPNLIGGLVVRVGSRMYDSSLRTKLQRLQLSMKGIA